MQPAKPGILCRVRPRHTFRYDFRIVAVFCSVTRLCSAAFLLVIAFVVFDKAHLTAHFQQCSLFSPTLLSLLPFLVALTALVRVLYALLAHTLYSSTVRGLLCPLFRAPLAQPSVRG